MTPILFGIMLAVYFGAKLVGQAVGTKDYYDAESRARVDRERLAGQARADAEAALKAARDNLEIQLGALGTVISGGELDDAKGWKGIKAQLDRLRGEEAEGITYAFDSYDDWYRAQEEEYSGKVDSGEYTGSWQDYLREQQVTELGQYGLERANLELQVMIARRA